MPARRDHGAATPLHVGDRSSSPAGKASLPASDLDDDQIDLDLPPLDADEGDDIDAGEAAGTDHALAEALLADSEGGLPAWADARLAVLEGAGAAVPCRSIAVAAGRVAAAGEVLLFVEEGARAARRLPFGEGVL